MTIQFLCPSCSQPIEVDREVGGKAAVCPYCRRVVAVPTSSTYDPQQLVTARPLPPSDAGRAGRGAAVRGTDEAGSDASAVGQPMPSSSSPPPPPLPVPTRRDVRAAGGGLHVGPEPDARVRAARAYGNYALICLAIALGLLGIAFYLMMRAFGHVLGTAMPQDPPTTQQVLAALRTPEARATNALMCGFAFFAIVALLFSGLSLRQRARGNWRGWTVVAVTCLLLGCWGVSFIFSAAMGFRVTGT